MSFALVSSTITQTGIDTSLAGLAGIGGVTTLTQAGVTAYNLGNYQLVITGTLTMDPRMEHVLFGSAPPAPQIQVNNGGIFNVGVDITANGVTYYPMALAGASSKVNATGSDDTVDAFMRVLSGGTINHRYGTFKSYGCIGLGDTANTASGTYNSFSPSACFEGLGTNGDGQQPQIRLRSTQTNIQGLTLQNFYAITLLGNAAQLKGAKSYHGAVMFAASTSSPASTWLTAYDPDFTGGTPTGVSFWMGKWLRMVDSVNGSAAVTKAHNASNTLYNYGLIEFRGSLRCTAKSSAGAAITVGGIFLRDKNNGLRIGADGVAAGSPSYTADRTYSATFNGSGLATYNTTGGVLLAAKYRTSAHTDGNEAYSLADYRGETNDSADSWIVRVRSYGYQFAELSAVLKGAGGTALNATLFANPDVKASSATAAAYTGITLTDHGGAPAIWNGKSWGITITANKTTNPGLTAQMIHDYLQFNLAQVGTAFNGKPGGEWHEMVQSGGGSFVTMSGTYGGSRTTKGVRVVDENGSAFAGFAYMTADDGSTYAPPVAVTLTVSAQVSLVGAEVRIYDLDNLPAGSLGTELAGVESCAGATFGYAGTAGNLVWVQIMVPGYEEFGQALVMPNSDAGFAATLRPDNAA